MNAYRFQLARELGMPLIGSMAGLPLFNGSKEQFQEFHRRLGTPTL